MKHCDHNADERQRWVALSLTLEVGARAALVTTPMGGVRGH